MVLLILLDVNLKKRFRSGKVDLHVVDSDPIGTLIIRICGKGSIFRSIIITLLKQIDHLIVSYNVCAHFTRMKTRYSYPVRAVYLRSHKFLHMYMFK